MEAKWREIDRENQVIWDIKSIGIDGWREQVKDRDGWKNVVEKAREHTNL